ncbi:hypothetical protein T484DRAFT_1852054 [Baffinella frigidus]|nr:hypothetical protein T484DRAFT_1852054 [Cryptophyta sp. CCMP2293]
MAYMSDEMFFVQFADQLSKDNDAIHRLRSATKGFDDASVTYNNTVHAARSVASMPLRLSADTNSADPEYGFASMPPHFWGSHVSPSVSPCPTPCEMLTTEAETNASPSPTNASPSPTNASPSHLSHQEAAVHYHQYQPFNSPGLNSPGLCSPGLNSPLLCSPCLNSPHLNLPHLNSPHLNSPPAALPPPSSPSNPVDDHFSVQAGSRIASAQGRSRALHQAALEKKDASFHRVNAAVYSVTDTQLAGFKKPNFKSSRLFLYLLTGWMQMHPTPYPDLFEKRLVAHALGQPLSKINNFCNNYRKRFHDTGAKEPMSFVQHQRVKYQGVV